MPTQRLHKSSTVLGVIITLLLMLICIPARVSDFQPGYAKTFEHGWPIVYLRRQTKEPPASSPTLTRPNVPAQLPMWGIPSLSPENWALRRSDDMYQSPRWRFNATLLIVDGALSALVIAVFVAAWVFRRRRRRHVISYTMTDMFVAVTVLSILLGYLVQLNRGYLQEVQLVTNSLRPVASCEEICIAPMWLRSLIGERFMPAFMWRVCSVSASGLQLSDASLVRNELARFL